MLGEKKKETVTFRNGWLEGDASASVSLSTPVKMPSPKIT